MIQIALLFKRFLIQVQVNQLNFLLIMNSLVISTLIVFFSQNDCNNVYADTSFQKQIIPIESAFNSITIYNNINVVLIEGNCNEILVSNKEIANKIKVSVDGNVLVIKCRHQLFNGDNLKVVIEVKSVNSITLMDDAEVRTVGCLSSPKLRLIINGDGAFYINTNAREVNTIIKGLGKIEVKGNFKNTAVNKDAYGNMVTTYSYSE
jgi:hypothetical protein